MAGTNGINAALLKAINFAAIKHRNQRRKDPEKTPYINHPIGVAFILSEEGGITDLVVLQAAILHDTVEDTDTTFDEIQTEFGVEVADVVKEVTDDKCLPKQTRKFLQIENAPKASHKAKLVKLADKIHNLRDLLITYPEGWSEQRVQEYFVWARQVTDGLRGTNAALEATLDYIFHKKGVL